MDTTTIQVRKETKEKLDRVKRTYHSKTYDEAIDKLVRMKTGSMYGAFAKEGKKYSLRALLKDLSDNK